MAPIKQLLAVPFILATIGLATVPALEATGPAQADSLSTYPLCTKNAKDAANGTQTLKLNVAYDAYQRAISATSPAPLLQIPQPVARTELVAPDVKVSCAEIGFDSNGITLRFAVALPSDGGTAKSPGRSKHNGTGNKAITLSVQRSSTPPPNGSAPYVVTLAMLPGNSEIG